MCVELRVNGSWKTFHESAELLDYGFDKFRHEEIDAALDTTTPRTAGRYLSFRHSIRSGSERSRYLGGRREKYRKRYDPEKLKTDKLEARFL